MGENVRIISSAYLEYVTRQQMHAVEEDKVNLVMTMWSVIEGWLADQVLYGLMRLSVFPWVTLTPGAKLTMTADLVTSAGENTLMKRSRNWASLQKYAWKSMFLLTARNSFGI